MSEYIEVELTLLPAASGGRSGLVSLAGALGIRYRPHLRLHPTGEHFGVEFVDGPRTTQPGDTVWAIARLVYEVDYSGLQPGAEFEVLEGGHQRVGTGTVLERWASEKEWHGGRPPK
jgi:hypothetical protein